MAELIRRLLWNLFLDRIGRKIGMILGAVFMAMFMVVYLGAREDDGRTGRLVTVPAEVIGLDITCEARAPPTANGRLDGLTLRGSCPQVAAEQRAYPARRFVETRRTFVTLEFVTAAGQSVAAKAPADRLGVDQDAVNVGDRLTIAYDPKAKPPYVTRPQPAVVVQWLQWLTVGAVLAIVGGLAWALDGFGGLDRWRRATD